MNITNEELGEIIASMDTVYTFVVESHNDYATPRDYGNGKMMNMSAIHTLTMIADNPGITAAEVAKNVESDPQRRNAKHKEALVAS